MRPALADLASAQNGVFTRGDALRCGYSERAVRAKVARGVWLRIRRGCYLDAGGGGGAVTLAHRVAAVRRTCGVDAVASGPTAVALHGMALLDPVDRLTFVSRDGARYEHGDVSIVPAELPDDHATVLDGLPVTSPARTVIDVARTSTFVGGVVTADSALHARVVTAADLAATLAPCSLWPGARSAARVLDFADGRAESAGESLGRVVFHENGLPSPDLQVVLGDDGGAFARSDFYWREHRTVGEMDGKIKYGDPQALWLEKVREDRLRDGGFEVVRFTWNGLRRFPRRECARVLAAFERAARRR